MAFGCAGDDGDGDDGGADTVAATSGVSTGTGSDATGATGDDGESTAAPACEFVDVGPKGCPDGTVQCQPLGPSFNCAPAELADACCQPCDPNECPG